jgi:serine phosphatase RsbU (regulator of sigma subunit)
MVSNLVGQGYFMAFAGPPISTVFEIVSWVARLFCIALMLWIAVEGIRREGLDGWLVLPAVILVGIARFTRELRLLHIQTNWYPFGIRIRLSDFANLLLIAVLALLLLRRLLLSIREQRRLALDVKQAKEVQQVILPEARTVFPGLVVETEYRPALQVGGDFFQVVPQADDSLLIVAGDVTGKGLKAGMLVALLVGAIRTAAELSSDPLLILRTLNRRLLGRGDAQATCLALRIDSGYRVTVANAGHIAPYLNGMPITIEGALPLGMIEMADFSVMHFEIKERDRLILMSDGIVEATDPNGRLFGFDRVADLLRSAASPADIAAAAQRFGQNDDISVISVTRTADLAPSPA